MMIIEILVSTSMEQEFFRKLESMVSDYFTYIRSCSLRNFLKNNWQFCIGPMFLLILPDPLIRLVFHYKLFALQIIIIIGLLFIQKHSSAVLLLM